MNLVRGIDMVKADAGHVPFVLDSFRRSLSDAGGVPRGLIGDHAVAVRGQILGGLGRVIVATPKGHPETFLGWAAESCGAMVFAYVPMHLRALGIARHMAAALFDSGPVRLVYWTDTAEAIKDHGFPIVHDWREFQRRERAIEKAARRMTMLIERTA